MTAIGRRAGRSMAAVLGLMIGVGGLPVAQAGSFHNARNPVEVAASPRAADHTIRACIDASADLYHLPPALFLIILHVEGGRPGFVTGNTNGSVDIGPMQINQIWLPTLARHWHATIPATFRAIRDNFCANVAAGGWILARSIRDAGGHLWQGVGYYHSRSRHYESAYLLAVLHEARRLQAQADRSISARGGGA